MTDELFDQVAFSGNKILRKDIAKDTEWYNSLSALNLAVKTFVKENFDKVWKWTGDQDSAGAEAYFTSATTDDKLNDFSSL